MGSLEKQVVVRLWIKEPATRRERLLVAREVEGGLHFFGNRENLLNFERYVGNFKLLLNHRYRYWVLSGTRKKVPQMQLSVFSPKYLPHPIFDLTFGRRGNQELEAQKFSLAVKIIYEREFSSARP